MESRHDAKYLAGGTNLLDLMKMGVEQPAALIDIGRLPLTEIEPREEGVRIGAIARNTDAAAHPLIRDQYPMLSEAILAAHPRSNMAIIAANCCNGLAASISTTPPIMNAIS